MSPTGKVKVLGVASSQARAGAAAGADLRRKRRAGLRLDIWFGVAAPAKTPPDVVARLSKEIAEIIEQPDVKERIAEDSA